jgi:hypothetical protein
MVGPGGVGHVDGGALAEEARVELEGKATTTSSGKNLGDSELRKRRVSNLASRPFLYFESS